MIQQTNARQASTSLAPLHQSQDGPEVWGQWSSRRHYSLEVVQHPVRARMCGFGDKDRRPLAPAAVAKMIVKSEDDSLVDVDDVDCSFFLVTVDLWSGDGKHEMNLVLHPSSTDRHPPPHSARPRRRGASIISHSRSSGNQTPAARTTPTPIQYRPGEPPSGYNTQTYFPPVSDQMIYSPPTPYSATPSEAPTWAYNAQSPSMERNNNFPPPLLPSIHTFTQSEPESGTSAYRAWDANAPYQPSDSYANSQVDPALRAPTNQDGREWSSQTDRYTQDAYPPTTPQLDNAIYTPASYAQHPPLPHHPHYSSHYPPHVHATSQQSANSIISPRHSYTRTLVGPLSSNASRLLDEHRKPGIFFLFQDLSIRTEGTFRLRLRLMNVGAPPAPDFGAVRVHNNISPVLAQTFTEPFIVYSAKRFPGVPDTTALSIAFGNQGQKLPLRNRHGSSKRRRRGDSDSDSDSDEEA